MTEWILRFLIGGIAVSFFAMAGDVLRPKSFAGLFSAAPSVALATVTLTIHKNGKAYAAHEAAFMALGAVAFLVYAAGCSLVLRRGKTSATATTVMMMPVWFVVAIGLWTLVAWRP
jgi:Protein of unknown function (DUF3147)